MISMKYLSLIVLVVQNTSLVLILRYSRTMEGPRYLASTAVLMSEFSKLITCFLIVCHQNSWNPSKTAHTLKTEIFHKMTETVKTSVPAVLYTIQNNLLFLALSNLDAATFQVTYQMKIITTAIFSVLLLQKKISPTQWGALGLLAIAVSLVQWPSSTPMNTVNVITTSMRLVGLLAIFLACISSGFSGVYFEKMLKGTNTSLWIRNIQLGFLSIVFATLGILFKDYQAVRTDGFFQGYNYIVGIVIALQAIGGLVVATVMKYADNILKGFATAISIVVSSVFSFFLLNDFYPSVLFIVGAVFVIASTVIYGHQQQLQSSKNSNNTPPTNRQAMSNGEEGLGKLSPSSTRH